MPIIKIVRTKDDWIAMQKALAKAEDDFLEARRLAYEWAIKTIWIEHFEPGASRRYGYTPNDPKYDKWKAKKIGHMTQLVFTGKLMNAVQKGRATIVGGKPVLLFYLPPYGDFQRAMGRDFLKLDARDYGRIGNRAKKEMEKIRRKRMSF
jgi:hypothetical protein